MSRLERWIAYPVLAVLCWASFGRQPGIGVRTALADEPAPNSPETKRFDVVEAKEFRLVDESGTERGTLRAPTKERPGGLYLWDKGGSPRAFLALGSNDDPMLGVGAIGLQARARGENTLEIVDSKGTTRVLLGVTSSGSSGLSVFDLDGRQRARILVDAAAAPSITLLGEQGKVLWEAPLK